MPQKVSSFQNSRSMKKGVLGPAEGDLPGRHGRARDG